MVEWCIITCNKLYSLELRNQFATCCVNYLIKLALFNNLNELSLDCNSQVVHCTKYMDCVMKYLYECDALYSLTLSNVANFDIFFGTNFNITLPQSIKQFNISVEAFSSKVLISTIIQHQMVVNVESFGT
jgi:hypothetical protein